MKYFVILLILIGFAGSAFASESDIPPPLKQVKNGVSVDEIICKENLELVFKMHGEPNIWIPACVKSETAEKLIYRGWIVTGERVLLLTEKTEYKIGELISVTMKNMGTKKLRTPSVPIGFSVYDDDNNQICNWKGPYEEIRAFPPFDSVTYIWEQNKCPEEKQVESGFYIFKADHFYGHLDNPSFTLTIKIE